MATLNSITNVQPELDKIITELSNKIATLPENDQHKEFFAGLMRKINAVEASVALTAPPTADFAALQESETADITAEKAKLHDFAKKYLNIVNQEIEKHNNIGNKTRMVEINTYFNKKYKAYSTLVYLFIVFSLPVLVLTILKKRSLLPSFIADIFIAIILVAGGYFIIRMFLDVGWRDSMNFDDYDWWYNVKANEPTVMQYNLDQWKNAGFGDSVKQRSREIMHSLGGSCIGEECCCGNTTYDDLLGKCKVEGFDNKKVNYILTDYISCPWKKIQENIIPYNTYESNN